MWGEPGKQAGIWGEAKAHMPQGAGSNLKGDAEKAPCSASPGAGTGQLAQNTDQGSCKPHWPNPQGASQHK